jgi:hypothetical protein
LKKSPAVWKLYFKRFSNPLEDSMHESNTIVDITMTDDLTQLQRAKDAFKTPSKRYNIPDMMDVAVSTQSLLLPKRQRLVRLKSPLANINEAELASKLNSILNEWNELVTQLETLQSEYDKRVLSDQRFRETIIDQCMDVQSEVNKIENMSRLIEDAVGESPKDNESGSVWDTLTIVSKEQEVAKESLKNISSIAIIEPAFKQLISEISKIKLLAVDEAYFKRIESSVASSIDQINLNKNNLRFLNQNYR